MKLTSKKAKVILREGQARGHALTKKQKRFFGAIAGGQTPRKVKDNKRLARAMQSHR